MKNLFFLFAACCGMFNATAQPASFESRGIGGGGALFFPTINPGNDNEFYVACDMSELFHSTDFGNSYSQIHFSELTVSGVSTFEFTNNSSIAYSGFNDGNYTFPVKTTDGGTTWSALTAYDVGVYESVYKMSANYNNPQQLLVSTYGIILFSNNGGTSFTEIRQAANNGVGLIMGGVFWDGSNIYIGTNEGILYSTNSGSSFSMMTVSGITAGQVIWSFAGGRSGGNRRFVCITGNAGDIYNGLPPYDYYALAKGVYVMNNANGTWIPKVTGINFSNDFVMYAGMAWNDINTIYLGGSDAALNAPLVFKSVNGGDTWTKKFNSANNANIATGWSGHQGDKGWSWGETCFGITVAPNNANKVMFSDFGYVHVSSNGGDNWKQAYVNTTDQHPAGAATPKNQTYHGIGLEPTTCWQVHWATPDIMMGCFSDIGGVRSADGGESWGYTYSGFSVNSLYRIAEGTNGTLYGACSNIHDMYQSTRLADAQLDATDNNGKIVYSTNDGTTWSTLHQFNHPVFWLAIDPNNQNRMYASVIHYGGGTGQGGIWVTNNLSSLASSTWTKLSNPPRTQGHPASIVVLNDGKVVCTYSGRRTGSGFTASSGVFIYDPVGNLWSDVSHPGMQYWTKDIIVDPNDAMQNTWYVCVFSGWGGAPNGLGGLYKTVNRGTNWTKLTGSQFDRVTSITFNPQNLTQAYLTTETNGLWVSDNMNVAIPTWTLVESYPFRQPERVFFNPHNLNEMWVTSFGNGLRVGNLEADSITISGGIFSEMGAPVPTVTLTLSGSVSANAVTGNNGLYSFTVPAGGNYTVTPSKANDVTRSNGITTLDISLLRNHILGNAALSSPYKIIAGDGSNSGSVSTLDITYMRKVILNNNETFLNGRLWEFVKSDYVFSNPQNPFPFEKVRTYNAVSQNQENQNFIGVKLGDVNNSWNNTIP